MHGTAALAEIPACSRSNPGADHVVRVSSEKIFVNCGPLHPPERGTELSPHLPDADGHQPFPAWKRIDLFEGALPAGDEQKVARKGGTIPLETPIAARPIRLEASAPPTTLPGLGERAFTQLEAEEPARSTGPGR